jgi:hypothetical protein
MTYENIMIDQMKAQVAFNLQHKWDFLCGGWLFCHLCGYEQENFNCSHLQPNIKNWIRLILYAYREDVNDRPQSENTFRIYILIYNYH